MKEIKLKTLFTLSVLKIWISVNIYKCSFENITVNNLSQKAFAKMPGLACKEGLNLPMVMYIFGGQKMKQYTSNKQELSSLRSRLRKRMRWSWWSCQNECMEKTLSCLGFIGRPGYDNDPVTGSRKRFMHNDLGTWYLIKNTQSKYWTLITTMACKYQKMYQLGLQIKTKVERKRKGKERWRKKRTQVPFTLPFSYLRAKAWSCSHKTKLASKIFL